MAITKIHAIKKTVYKAIEYITDPNKTAGKLLVTAKHCSIIGAALEFKMTELTAKDIIGDYTRKGPENKAYHLIQSFSELDEISKEQVHEIGIRLADELLEDNYEYVIATHIDRDHIHNHIIFNAYSFVDYKKYRSIPYKTVKIIRDINDSLCQEYGLSYIEERKKIGYSYKEAMERKKNTSWKSEIRKRLEYILESTMDYEEFDQRAYELGIDIDHSSPQIKYRYRFDESSRYLGAMKLSSGDRYKYGVASIKKRIEDNQKMKSIESKKVLRKKDKGLDEESVSGKESIRLDEELIEKRTLEGLIIKCRDLKKMLFIPDSVLLPSINGDGIMICAHASFRFYEIKSPLDPDILESHQLTKAYIMAKQLIEILNKSAKK